MHKIWTLTHQGYTSWESKYKDEMNSEIEVLVVKPQALDQSKRVRIKPSRVRKEEHILPLYHYKMWTSPYMLSLHASQRHCKKTAVCVILPFFLLFSLS